ncbi:MAG: signal recognition particle receptor subunit alpha [Candidatus Micrarchaeota archaeon]|nr:signal recognition particle receptor subunit alpha [Candidatus Micrarchaeota archaeon]
MNAIVELDLGRRIRNAIAGFSGKAYIDEKAVKELVKELQRTLISADVDVHLVLKITKEIERKALDLEKKKELAIREQVVRVVYDELVALLGESYEPKIEKKKILLVGLYGSGKTTTAAKLGKFYKAKGMKVAVVCADTDRPAAYEQLQQLCEKAGLEFYGEKGEKDSAAIVSRAMQKLHNREIVIVDSSGRNALESSLIDELKRIVAVFSPDEKILVVSADIGQVAGKQAKAFDEGIGVDGIIVTKADGSAKAGGALSAAHHANAKVMFIGTGEHIDELRPYDSKKYVARLLGFPDLEALLEKVKAVEAESGISKKMLKEEKLTMKTFLEQIKAAKKMGPLKDVFSMMGAPDVPEEILQQGEGKMKKFEAMINSMTPAERDDPEIIKKSASRISRIAKGSGCSVAEVRELLRQFDMINKMMYGFKKDRGMRRQIERIMKGGFRF